MPSTLPSPGPQVAGARMTPGPSWINPRLGMGILRISQLAVGRVEFRIEGAMCKQRRATKETGGETRNQTSTNLGGCLTRFWFLSDLAVCTLCKEQWETLLEQWFLKMDVHQNHPGSLFMCQFLRLPFEQVCTGCRGVCLEPAP